MIGIGLRAAAGSHGSLFFSTSLNFRTVSILCSRAFTLYSSEIILYFAATAARALYPRAILVEPNLCSCFGSNLLQLSERNAASA